MCGMKASVSLFRIDILFTSTGESYWAFGCVCVGGWGG